MTVSKTVRIPEELVAFVEARPGDTFTEKLVGLLDDLANGEDKRLDDLAFLDKQIEDRRAKLSGYWELVAKVNNLEHTYRLLLNALEKDLKDSVPSK